MRIADAEIMPYSFNELELTINGYATNLKSELKQLQMDAATRSHLLKNGAYVLANDPKNPVGPPPELPMPPAMDFTALDSALEKLKAAAAHYAQASVKAPMLPADKRKQINDGLAVAERKLIAADGLPGRPWVKHLIYAPGTYTGYGASTLPGVREALEAGRFDEAKQQLGVLTQALNDEAAFIEGLASQAGE
jgi:N-acetylated-alpha-linked acidic dipeptidase